jgi:hypothetical protein
VDRFPSRKITIHEITRSQTKEASLDGTLHTSPFLTSEDKALVISLPA